MAQADLSSIPNLPGYAFRRRQKNYRRPQTFSVVPGALRVEQQEGLTFERPKLVKVELPPDPRRHGSTLPMSTSQEEYQAPPRTHVELPSWDALDRHVLRFYGHFKESVVETNLESNRVRQCAVLYYLEDDTCHVVERKQENSGISQGQFIRRHRFPGPNGGYLSPSGLSIGSYLNVYGRNMYLTDCDDFTRAYYKAQGMEQAPREETELDAYGSTLSQMQERGGLGVPKTHERLYREVQLGGGHVNANMQQFMEWDGKVCRFYAVIDDLNLPQHERRPFVILYFLADDTVEIREQYPLNCGRDPFPIFFGRKKMPRGPAGVTGGPFQRDIPKDECLHVRDLKVGGIHELMGRKFFIYDADPFTREYLQTEFGDKLAECQDVRLPERAVARAPTPPYTGYGSWDDSMGSVHALVPKQPRKDHVKLYVNDGKVLRFTAKYVNPKHEDADRMFVVNFDLADDTLSIHEPPQRHIGIVTGKFLEKGVHVNQTTGNLFQPQDLYPGAIITVYNRDFEITDMDEYTRKWFLEPSAKRNFDLESVLEKLRESLRQQYPLVRDIFRKFDADHDGVLTMHEFRQALAKWGFQLSEEDSLVLMRHFDTHKDGQLSYNEFCDALLDEDYTTEMIKSRPQLEKNDDLRYSQRAHEKVEERIETEKVRAAVRAMGDVVYRHTQAFMKLFKEFAHVTHGDTVTCGQIVQAFEQIGAMLELDDVIRTVLFVLPGADPDKVKYTDFLKAMVASYHDFSAIR